MRYYIVLVVALFATACQVVPEDVEVRKEACMSHGGLKRFYVGLNDRVICKDGTIILSLSTSYKKETP